MGLLTLQTRLDTTKLRLDDVSAGAMLPFGDGKLLGTSATLQFLIFDSVASSTFLKAWEVVNLLTQQSPPRWADVGGDADPLLGSSTSAG